MGDYGFVSERVIVSENVSVRERMGGESESEREGQRDGMTF